MNRLFEIRQKEKEYHEKIYNEIDLFCGSSWLNKPVRTVLDSFEYVHIHKDLMILDVGSGIGRNAIPLAEKLIETNGKVICLDLLDIAISKLKKNASNYGVEEHVEGVVSSIEEYNFMNETYDFVVAVSTLEHVESVDKLKEVLNVLEKQTRTHGVHCLILNTNVKEFIKETNEEIEPQFELNLTTKQMLELLNQQYKGWGVLKKDTKRYNFDIERNNEEVILDTTVLTYVVQKLKE